MKEAHMASSPADAAAQSFLRLKDVGIKKTARTTKALLSLLFKESASSTDVCPVTLTVTTHATATSTLFVEMTQRVREARFARHVSPRQSSPPLPKLEPASSNRCTNTKRVCLYSLLAKKVPEEEANKWHSLLEQGVPLQLKLRAGRASVFADAQLYLLASCAVVALKTALVEGIRFKAIEKTLLMFSASESAPARIPCT
eukprot:IDg21450t1